MARKNFAEIMADGEVNIAGEYRSLHELFYQRFGLYNQVADHFDEIDVGFRDTAIDIDDFNRRNHFDYEHIEVSENIDTLLGLCEYVYNLAVALNNVWLGQSERCIEAMRHVDLIANKLHYERTEADGFVVLVSSNANIMAAAEIAPEGVEVDLITYDYRKYEGNLKAKRAILVRLLSALEPKRGALRAVSSKLEGDLSFIANNLNLRHNNLSPGDKNYKQAVAKMDTEELESWYDLCRDMCAAAFLLLAYSEKRPDIDELGKAMKGK